MTAALFAAVLSHKLAPFSIKVYISAISLLHCREGLQSPTTHSTWDSKTTQPTHGKQDYTLQAMLNHLQHCLKWRRHDCDMLSTAISLIWFLVWEQYTISSHHSFNPCLSQLDHTHKISHFQWSSHIYYHTIQNRSNCSWTHNHTACHRRKLCPVWIITSLECLHLINHFSHRNKVHLSHCSCWFQRTLHKLLDHMTRHNTHSLWMGGATSAAEADGCIRHTIKRLWH